MGGAHPHRSQDAGRHAQGLVQGRDGALSAGADIEAPENGFRHPDRPVVPFRSEGIGARCAAVTVGLRARAAAARLCAEVARSALRWPARPPHTALGAVDARIVVPHVDRRPAGSRDLAPGSVAIPSEARRLRVVILSRRLVAGGSERQALLLAEGLAERGHQCTLVLFRAEPDDPRPAAIRVIDLGGHRWWSSAGFLSRLQAAVRESDANIVYGFLPVANLLALLLGGLRSPLKVVLGMRASDLDLRRYGLRSRLAAWTETRFAHRADAIIVNSEAGYRHAISRGIPGELMTVVRNGVDLDRFQHGPVNLRSELGIEPGAVVIGLVARPDPMKGLETFAH